MDTKYLKAWAWQLLSLTGLMQVTKRLITPVTSGCPELPKALR